MTKKNQRRKSTKTSPGGRQSVPWGWFTVALVICWGIIIWLLPIHQEEKSESKTEPLPVTTPSHRPKEKPRVTLRTEVAQKEHPPVVEKKEPASPPEVKPPVPQPEQPPVVSPTSTNTSPVAEIPPPAPVPAPKPSPVPVEEVKPAEPIPTEEPKTELDFATWQVAMERHHFSAGTIDGDVGMRSRRSIIQYQKSQNLPVTGKFDFATRLRMGKPNQPFIPYDVTEADMKEVAPPPGTWKERAEATYLGYVDSWYMLADKGHTTVKFLKILNPGIETPKAGDTVVIPNVAPDPKEKLPEIERIRIILSETTLLGFDVSDKIVLCFPCSIAANKNKVPAGALSVAVVAPNPNYTYNPEMFPIDSKLEGITNRLIIPPGPNNPVGLAWIGLSQPGYGIHGTPDATAISRTGSHGCFRLANWNAVLLSGLVHRGVPVEVVP